MDITNKSHIYWACRRGMRELDISIIPFFQYEYDSLDDTEKQLFVCLLENDDQDLFNWLMNHGEPANLGLKKMVALIQKKIKNVVLCQYDRRSFRKKECLTNGMKCRSQGSVLSSAYCYQVMHVEAIPPSR